MPLKCMYGGVLEFVSMHSLKPGSSWLCVLYNVEHAYDT
jgi:hypothetical protein